MKIRPTQVHSRDTINRPIHTIYQPYCITKESHFNLLFYNMRVLPFLKIKNVVKIKNAKVVPQM